MTSVERAPGQADADAVLADDRRRHHRRLLVLDWHRGAAVTALTPALSCRSCRPNAPFAELVCLSKSSVAEEY